MPYVVETGKAKVSVKEYTERCVDVERFLGFCRECSSYNTVVLPALFPFSRCSSDIKTI